MKSKKIAVIAGALLGLALIFVLSNRRAVPPGRQQTSASEPVDRRAAGVPTSAPPLRAQATSAPAAVPPTSGPAALSQAAGSPITRTLESLRQIDDHPLYTMTYYGPYDLSAAQAPALPAGTAGPPTWACSLFIAFADPRHAIYGRNFDWDPDPALLLFTDPPDGYASVSMVDLRYLGFDRDKPDALADREQRLRLLGAPLLPFDGMNEYGLTVGMAAVDESTVPNDSGKPTVGSLRIIRLMLDRARTAEEAIALLQNYNIDFEGGPPLHYLIADPGGHSAVVEFKDGAIQVIRNDKAWQAATNFYLAGAGEGTKQQDWRYRTAGTAIAASRGVLSWEAAMDLLAQVAQPHTQWSIVYSMSTGEVHIATSRRYDRLHAFQFPLIADNPVTR